MFWLFPEVFECAESALDKFIVKLTSLFQWDLVSKGFECVY